MAALCMGHRQPGVSRKTMFGLLWPGMPRVEVQSTPDQHRPFQLNSERAGVWDCGRQVLPARWGVAAPASAHRAGFKL